MLKLKSEKNIVVFDGTNVDLEVINPQNFLLANMTIPVELEENLTLGELVDKIGYIKSFVENCFSESLDVLNILVSKSELIRKYSKIRLYKEIGKDEIGYVNVVNNAEFIAGEDGTSVLKDLVLEIDENLRDNEVEKTLAESAKTKFTFFDLLSTVFEDVMEILQKDGILV